MVGTMRGHARLFALVGAVLGLASCELTPHGEVLVVVDGDLPLTLANRLRVDVFDANGVWYLSRDVGLPDARDWPASFSVYAGEHTDDRVVYLRLRAYPAGATRDYRGERHQPRQELRTPTVATSVDALCAGAPILEVGGVVTLRRGREPFIGPLTGETLCDQVGTVVGSAAVAFDIPKSGVYTVGLLGTLPEGGSPYPSRFHQTTLQLRTRCDLGETGIACTTGIHSLTPPDQTWELPRFTQWFAPGRYYLVTGGGVFSQAPTDLVIGLATPAEFSRLSAIAEPWDAPNDPAPIDVQLKGGSPATEPLPTATVDRLVKLRIRYGVRDRVRVVLHGACAGAMSKLGDDHVDFAVARTCIDDPSALANPSEELSVPVLPARVARTFGQGLPCPPAVDGSTRVCVPGGAFLMGGYTPRDTAAPVRTAAVSTFWMDRYEVSIGRFRAALAAGLVLGPFDRPIAQASTGDFWTEAPGTHEGHPVTLLNWYAARAFCVHEGGDLPTDAQWEYAAGAAGRTTQTTYPWGFDLPTCDCTDLPTPCHRIVMGRRPGPYIEIPGCTKAGNAVLGSDPVDSIGGENGDETPLGIVGMAGNAAEWTLDAFEPYDGRCWRAAGVMDPGCFDEHGVLRDQRGAGFMGSLLNAVAFGRLPQEPGEQWSNVGFRCAYGSAQ
jgi:formylglycine-generating enzyme required for sulfatase activity